MTIATPAAARLLMIACALAPMLAWAQAAGGDNYDSNLLGDMAGLRPFLATNGLTFSLNNTAELLGNPTGGLRQELVFEGGALGTLVLDGDKAGLWPGLTVQVTAWGIYGRGLSANALNNIDTASNVEANRSLRLYDLWAQQAFAGGKVSVRVGQMGADEEFAVDQYAAPFINAEDGFPALPSSDLPSGGPAFPLATPAVRLKFQPSESTAILVALFNGNPAPGAPLFGQADGNAQNLDGSGTTFRINGGALWFSEVQYTASPGGQPGTYKFGAWYNSGVFYDQRLDNTGQSLASPTSTGQPLVRRGDWSL
jgi:porin